jgi:hypothetical protein
MKIISFKMDDNLFRKLEKIISKIKNLEIIIIFLVSSPSLFPLPARQLIYPGSEFLS